MSKTKPFMAALVLVSGVALFASTACAGSNATRSLQEMRNLDAASKMHGLQESDHGRIYGWGERDNYKDVAKPAHDDAEKPRKELHSQMHHYNPHAGDEGDKE